MRESKHARADDTIEPHDSFGCVAPRMNSTAPAPSRSDLVRLRDQWIAAWPAALAAWSKFTRLRPPTFCLSDSAAKEEGLQSSFAMIRLLDQSIVVNLEEVAASHVEPYAMEILAHEIGHHVL